jgi:hypothetical protein
VQCAVWGSIAPAAWSFMFANFRLASPKVLCHFAVVSLSSLSLFSDMWEYGS